MNTCKFILTRGKNKGKECGRKNCKHAKPIVKNEFDDIVQSIMTSYNANIGMCLHEREFIKCDICKSCDRLGQCDICKVNGDFDSLQSHVLQHHTFKKILGTTCTTYRQIIDSYTERNIKCPQIGCTIENCTGKVHFQPIITPSVKCPHSCVDGYCRTCISHRGKNKWYCKCCNGLFKKNAVDHYRNLHVQMITCFICNRNCPDNHTHENIYPICPISNCNYKFTKTVTDEMLYNHLIKKHSPTNSCQICPNVYRCNHVTEYELHTLIRNPNLSTWMDKTKYIQWMRQYNPDVSDLEYTTLTFPKDEIVQRVDKIIETIDNPDINKIPNDVWGIICSYLDINSKYNMQFVSKRFKEISDAFVSEWERFLYYGLYKIEPEKDALCMTSAKKAYCLTDKDLVGVSHTLKPNPHYRSAAPMKMYTKLDLIRVAYKKYQNRGKMVTTKKKRDETSYKRQETKAKQRQDRETALRLELLKYDLYIRNDSRVCNEYIQTGSGPNGENLQDVVEVMREMDWFFKHTNYRHVFQNIKDEYRWNREWYDIVDVSEEAKERVMQAYKRNGRPSEGLPRNVLQMYNQV